jgi:hypothetical protein
MRAIQNIPNQVLNEVAKAQQAEKTGKDFDVLGAIGNVVTAPVRGFVSNNPEDQPYGAQLIEKATDVIGANDPRYKNVQDNVNPWVKGIGGFALDVGLDPITYLPGGLIVAGTRGAVAGAKAATAAGQSGLKGAYKGVKTGSGKLPEYKIGDIGKQMKPVGIDQLRQNKAFEKLNRNSLKTNIPAESLFKFSEGGDIGEIVAGINAGIATRKSKKPIQEVTPESFLETYRRNQKLLPEAKKFDERLQALDADRFIKAQQEAAEQLAKQADAGAQAARQADEGAMPAPDTASTALMDELDSRSVGAATKAKTPAERVAALSEDARVSSVLRNALDSKAETTAAGRVKPIDEWISSQIELAGTNPKLRVSGGGKSIPVARLADYARLKDASASSLPNADFALKQRLDEIVPAAYDDYVKSLGGKTAPKAEGLREWLADPANRVAAEEALGEKALERVGVLSDDKIESAFKFLAQALEDPNSISSVASFGRTAEQQFAKNVVENYEMRKIEDLPVTQVETASQVNSPVVAEINAANEQGENLISQYWADGLQSEEEAKFILSAVKAYWAEALLQRTTFKFTSPLGASKSKPELFEGSANWINQFNGIDQSILWKNIATPTYRRFKERNDFWREEAERLGDRKLRNRVIAGAKRAGVAGAEIDRLFKAARRLIDQNLGVAAWLGKGDLRIPMYLDQAIDTLREVAYKSADSSFKRHLVDMAIFNKETLIPMSNFQESIARLVLNPQMPREEFAAILRQDAKGAFNILTDASPNGRYGFIPGEVAPSPVAGIRFEAKIEKGKTIGWYAKAVPQEFEKAFTDLVYDSIPDLQKVVDDNRIAAAKRVNAEYIDITKQQWEKITNMVLGADEAAEGIRTIANVADSVAAAGAAGRATFDAQANASKDIVNLLSSDGIHSAQDYVKTERILKTAKDDTEIGVKNAEKNWKDSYYVKWGEERVKSSGDAFNGVNKAGDVTDEALYSTALARESYGLRVGRTAQRFRSFFDKKAGAEDVIYPWAGQESNFSMIVHKFNSNLADVARKFNVPIGNTKTTVASKALIDLANNKLDDPLTREAVAALKPLTDYLFGTPNNRALTSVWLAEGANMQAFETYVTRAGKLEFPFDMNALAIQAKKRGISEIEVALEDWKVWANTVDNPFDFLEKMNYAATRFFSDKALALSLRSVRGGVSSKPAVGFSSIGKNYQYGENPLLAHLPPDLIVADELLAQIKQLETIMMETSSYHGPFKNFINDKYMPILSRWKTAVTVYRLGHHVRNDVSNKSIQLLLDGEKNFLWSHKAGWKVMMAYRGSDAFDMVKQAENLELNKIPEPSDVLFSSKRFGDWDVEDANAGINRGGLYENYTSVEDVINTDETQGFIGKAVDVATFRDTAIERAASKVSDTVSWQNRAAHWLQFVRNNADSGLYKTRQELEDAASAHVRRAQPSNLMLTAKEKQLRLLVPFYGWFRQALPVVIEGMVNQPGRFMMVPKASFNLAIGMGVNPYQMYDPFPQDQLFPSYVKDQLLGPIAKINGKYYTVTPGLAPVDLLNQFVPDPLRGIAGMATPFVKVPGEILGGASWYTGARINDMSDYWDAQLPGINYISSMTGNSVTGSVFSLISGQGLDPQYAVDRGSKTPGDQALSVANWFTGMSVSNISKPSFINYAELELKRKAAEEAARQAGTARSPF